MIDQSEICVLIDLWISKNKKIPLYHFIDRHTYYSFLKLIITKMIYLFILLQILLYFNFLCSFNCYYFIRSHFDVQWNGTILFKYYSYYYISFNNYIRFFFLFLVKWSNGNCYLLKEIFWRKLFLKKTE